MTPIRDPMHALDLYEDLSEANFPMNIQTIQYVGDVEFDLEDFKNE